MASCAPGVSVRAVGCSVAATSSTRCRYFIVGSGLGAGGTEYVEALPLAGDASAASRSGRFFSIEASTSAADGPSGGRQRGSGKRRQGHEEETEKS
jgi:hypothetical protein